MNTECNCIEQDGWFESENTFEEENTAQNHLLESSLKLRHPWTKLALGGQSFIKCRAIETTRDSFWVSPSNLSKSEKIHYGRMGGIDWHVFCGAEFKNTLFQFIAFQAIYTNHTTWIWVTFQKSNTSNKVLIDIHQIDFPLHSRIMIPVGVPNTCKLPLTKILPKIPRLKASRLKNLTASYSVKPPTLISHHITLSKNNSKNSPRSVIYCSNVVRNILRKYPLHTEHR